MKDKKREFARGPAAPASHAPAAKVRERRPDAWMYWAACAAALIALFWAYSPAMHAPFLFDDTALPFSLPGFSNSLGAWIGGLRSILMFTYWINVQISGQDSYSYHVVNVLIHCVSTGLIFLIVRRFLEWSGIPAARLTSLAALAAGVFLLHPVQTEAVAYLAGRSEALSAMMVFLAFTVFLYRSQQAATWGVVIMVLGLFGAALLCKEHTIVLPALLLLTDFWWNPGFSLKGILRNWRLYSPLALGAVAGFAFYFRLMTTATTAGFGMKEFTWYQYFFTQWRALFVYMREFILPVNLNADWDFPISKTIFDYGAIVGLIGLLALAAAAWIFRRRFPLATFGFFVYLVLMSPTSSILPIKDALAERRLYFSMVGLLLIFIDVVSRLKVTRQALAGAAAALLLAEAVVTHARAEVWSGPIPLWQDVAVKSPGKSRAHFQLASAYYNAGLCGESVAEYQKTGQQLAQLAAMEHYNLLVDWALAYDCNNQAEEAVAKLHEAAALESTAHVYSQIGMVYAKRSQWALALDALAKAEQIDGNYAPIFLYKGNIALKTNQLSLAVAEFRHVLAIDPDNQDAKNGLAAAARSLRAAH